ncbi:MAG: type II toxin-antitoxin system PemK/MazF family toxin [Pseudomonadota bacterium]
MTIKYHPAQGAIVFVDFSSGFVEPEMVKKRPAVVLSPNIKARAQLVTVVALSTTAPNPVQPYHTEIDVPLQLPRNLASRCWVKGDMVNAVGFQRVDLIRLGKDRTGRRRYQEKPLPPDVFRKVRRCVLHGIGLSTLTKHL